METATETVKCYTKEETLRENTAVSCEDILPDYLQDIEKIAKVDAVLLPQQHSMESAALCCRGNVVFTVVYFSPDGEIFTRQITLPYEINCKAEHLTPQSIVRIGQKAEGVSCRVATPRKLMLRAQVRTELCRYEPPCTEAKLEGDADACGKIMQRKHSVTGCRMLAGEDRDAKLGADLVLPGNYPEIETLLDTTLTPLPPKTTMQQGGIEYSAPCRVLLFYKGSDGEYYSYSQTVQTEGLIPIAEASPKMSCFAQSTLCSKSVQSAPDNMGQMRVVEIDALLHIECTCFQNTPMQITVDAFSANCPLKADYAPLRCEELCLCTKSALTLSGSTKTESPVKKSSALMLRRTIRAAPLRTISSSATASFRCTAYIKTKRESRRHSGRKFRSNTKRHAAPQKGNKQARCFALPPYPPCRAMRAQTGSMCDVSSSLRCAQKK